MMANHFPTQLSGTAGQHSFGSPAYGPPARTYATQASPAPDNPGPKRKLTHKCPWKGCNRWLSCPHNIDQHIREAHTKEKPYQCDRCHQSFTRPWGLYRHLRGKHGVQEAGPGRGRGGGLERIGVEVPQARKEERRGRKKGRRTDGTVERAGGVRLEQQVPLPPPPSQQCVEGPAGFEVNNFAPIPTACQQCGASFGNREALLSHLHNEHGEPSSPHCNCMLCLCTFGGDVDAAGVHVREVGAGRMRGLMAGDLFGDDSGGVAGRQEFPGVKEKNVGDEFGVKLMLAGMGMTDEQFTANMHMRMDVDASKATTPLASGLDAEAEARFTADMPKPTFPPLTPGAEARSTANMPAVSNPDTYMGFGGSIQDEQMDVDELMGGAPDDVAFDAWLKSAEEVFGDV